MYTDKMFKGITTLSVKPCVKQQRQVFIDLYVTLPMMLGNGGGSILEHHNVFNGTNLTLPLPLPLTLPLLLGLFIA